MHEHIVATELARVRASLDCLPQGRGGDADDEGGLFPSVGDGRFGRFDGGLVLRRAEVGWLAGRGVDYEAIDSGGNEAGVSTEREARARGAVLG